MNTGVWNADPEKMSVDVDALALYDDPERYPMVVVMRSIGMVFGGTHDAADAYLDEMVDRTDGWPQATLLMIRALRAENDGEIELSRTCLDRGLASFRAIGERFGLAGCLELHARLVVLDGHLETGLATLAQAAVITRELGAFEDAGQAMCWRAGLHIRRGDVSSAQADLIAAEADFDRVGSVFGGMLVEAARGQIKREQGDFAGARERLARARARVAAEARTTPPQFLAMLLVAAADVEFADGQYADGAILAREAVTTAITSQDLPVVSLTAVLAASMAHRLGDPALAAQTLGAADRLRGAPDPTLPDVIALERDLAAELGTDEYAGLREKGHGLDRDDALALVQAAVGL